LGEHLHGELFGADDDFPDLADDGFQELDVALLDGDGTLPIPLVDVGAVVVIEEIILADWPACRCRYLRRACS